MIFVAGAVIWAGYTLAWWGWEALTDRVPPGAPDTFWWPSIRDLVAPGRQGAAVPPRLLRSPAIAPAPVVSPEAAAGMGVGGVEIAGGGA